jgi:hypothetical protein
VLRLIKALEKPVIHMSASALRFIRALEYLEVRLSLIVNATVALRVVTVRQ